ncbi:hypothetical protein CC1G_02614 [Coprinopsis cinerea okayama7|uniref:Spindle assembly checkpoint component MAD1 n=1 Tax=Coprinopsis cinerea (strain Okayama-7 / 130 / ATCC MYA-4618 / FGSC 9003) TaxID=240176 RepID=A8PBC7_COPC7|nr:hypothetical protein CC1G_02614 [Coprinopsis cinerea okayama7\|eukprot:XP_001840151.1 hypothetical protein CC1G_02614 [Coprinopsis cinerea okayama7\
MSGENFKTPLSKLRFDPKSARSTAAKRDSLAAELERDPQLSTAKRQQRTQVFNSTISHANLERQLLAAQTANAELEAKLREKELLIERLERDRRWFADREKEEREEKEREREAHDEAQRKADSDIRNLRTSLTTLREEYADLQDTHSALGRSTSQTIASQKAQITTLNHRVDLLQDELSQAQQMADERDRRLADLQARYDDLDAQQDTLVHSGAEQESMVIIREELQRQASYLRTLESTNAKLSSELTYLRERNTNIEVLREEKRGLELKLTVLDELREKVVRLEAEVEAARREREEWASKESGESKAASAAVSQNLTELRLAHARLMEEHGATVASLRQREVEAAHLEKQEAVSQQKIQSLEEQLNSIKQDLARKDSAKLLAEREVQYLQALLASFKAEEEFLENPPSVDEAKAQKMEELESLLEEYKAINVQLSNDVEELQAAQASSSLVSNEELEKMEKEKAALRQTIEEHEAEIKEHLEKIDKLEQELFDLSGEIAGGRHVPPKTRVLCMKENPDQEWVDLRQATMDRIRAENDALIQRLKELEAGRAVAADSSQEEALPKESYDQLKAEKLALEELVEQKEKRLLRLREVFIAKSAEFKDAIAAILGLKFAFYPNGQVRVTSMYDVNAAFIFQPVKGEDSMKMQLVAQGEGGLEDLPNMVQYWIEGEQCTAGFLASVTLECYDIWKRNNGGQGGPPPMS